MAPRHVVGSQDIGSHGHVFDPHPQQLGKGKERGPRSLGPKDFQVDGYIGSNADVCVASSSHRSQLLCPSSTTIPSPSLISLINQGPPHRTTPLVDPDTAHSSSRIIRPSQAQREVSALNERLADAEAVISRQESELDHAKSQASAVRSQMAAKRHTTLFVDQHAMAAMINQSSKNRAQDIEAQLGIIEDQLDQTAVSLELAEGKKEALQSCKHQLVKDQADLRDLRQIVAAAEHNVRRHERLIGAEDRVKGLLCGHVIG
ncbi:hypothetical protein N7527_000350 [Penicillium freii]|nr:hypothetical protein N7527_000350 [Penicillium freii]